MENKGWKDIEKANSEMELFTMKRKEKDEKGNWQEKEVKYAEVKERVIAFRKNNPNGAIITEPSFTENYIMVKATIYSNYECITSNCQQDMEKQILATGYARELANKSYALENAETSAIGRALGFCGYGIKTSIASKEDIDSYEDSKIFNDEQIANDKKRREEATANFNKLSVGAKANILNLFHTNDITTINLDTLEELIRNAK